VLAGQHEASLGFLVYPGPAAVRVAVEERIGHKVRLNYCLCACGQIETRRRGGVLVCADCGRPASQGFQGWRAVWEFVYGPWRGAPDRAPKPRPEAVAALDRWKRNGVLNSRQWC
jgi:hypothetical protein